MPYTEAPLYFIGLGYAFFNYARRLKQNAILLEALWDLNDIFGLVHVILGKEPVEEIDAVLEVCVVRSRIVLADFVVNTAARSPDSGRYIVSGGEFGNVFTDLFDYTEALVPNDKEIASRRGCPVFGGVYFLVGSVNSAGSPRVPGANVFFRKSEI